MTRALVHVVSGVEDISLHAKLADDVRRAAEHAKHARASSTRRAYARAWEAWTAYAEAHSANALPASPLVVAAYLAHLDAEGLGASSIDVALASIVDAHRAADLDPPTTDRRVRDVRAGLRAQRGTRHRAKAALAPFELREMIGALPPDLKGTRDRALLLCGFASALRRSELVALFVEDLEFTSRGVVFLVRRSKTDQQGQGVEVPIHAAPGPLCPVAALRAWLEASGIESGPVFRSVSRWGRVGSSPLSDRFVASVVKHAAARVGLEPRELGGHSLRSGFATTAARQGANLAEIGAITRHASADQIAKYIRRGTLFEADPLRGALAR